MPPLSAEDLVVRRDGISATDATIIAGVSPYGKTVHDVYIDKLGLHGWRAPTGAQSIGHLLEPVALSVLASTCELTIVPGATERHPEMTWVVASPDGNVLEAPGGQRVGVAEAKAVGFHMARRWGESGDPDAIPDEVRVQVTWQMTAARVRRAHVVALIGTEPRIYIIEQDDDLSSALLDLCDKFRRKHVLARVPPPIDGSEASSRMVRALFKRATAGIVRAPTEAEEIVREYFAAKDNGEQSSRRLDSAKARLCAMIGESAGIESDEWVATWKAREGSPDWKAIALALGATPDLISKYRGEGPRVLNVRSKGKRAA